MVGKILIRRHFYHALIICTLLHFREGNVLPTPLWSLMWFCQEQHGLNLIQYIVASLMGIWSLARLGQATRSSFLSWWHCWMLEYHFSCYLPVHLLRVKCTFPAIIHQRVITCMRRGRDYCGCNLYMARTMHLYLGNGNSLYVFFSSRFLLNLNSSLVKAPLVWKLGAYQFI